MKIEFDPKKNAANVEKHGVSFDRAADLDWERARYAEDIRKDYGERRIVALALLDRRLHSICFKPIAGGIRGISLRKANDREVRRYGEITATKKATDR